MASIFQRFLYVFALRKSGVEEEKWLLIIISDLLMVERNMGE